MLPLALAASLALSAADGGVELPDPDAGVAAPVEEVDDQSTPPPPPKKKVVLGQTPIKWPPDLVRFTTWELSFEGGPGLSWNPGLTVRGLVRARVGVLRVDNDWHYSGGVIAEWRNPNVVAVGMQGEVMNLEKGFWGQGGFVMDVTPEVRPGLIASVGYSLLGVELQARPTVVSSPAEIALYLKLRLPLRHFLLALGVRPKNEANEAQP